MVCKIITKWYPLWQAIKCWPDCNNWQNEKCAKNVAINDEDYTAFKTIVENDVAVYFQLIPEDEKRSWDDIDKKYLAD